MAKEGKIHFALRKDKKNSDGKLPLSLIYSLHGQRKFYMTKHRLFDVNWNSKEQKAILIDKKQAKKEAPGIEYEKFLSGTEAERINNNIGVLRSEVKDIVTGFEIKKIAYSSKDVMEKFLAERNKKPETKKEEPADSILDFIDEFITSKENKNVKGSLSIYRSLKNNLSAMASRQKTKLTFADVDLSFMEEFENFLIVKRELSNSTINKQVKTLKAILGYAKKKNKKFDEGYKEFKPKLKERTDVIALFMDEFETLYNLDLSTNKRLEQLRDVFCFGCVTGLRYSDLAQLKPENVYEDKIHFTSEKTKEDVTVHLNKYSFAILKKYKGKHKSLPVISNQKMNKYLKGWDDVDGSGRVIKHHKGLCEIAGLNRPTQTIRYSGSKIKATTLPLYKIISSHSARKTFVTLSLELGMNAQEVMKITGHKDYKSFDKYVQVADERKKIVMSKAWGAPKTSKLKAV
jgi:integrase